MSDRANTKQLTGPHWHPALLFAAMCEQKTLYPITKKRPSPSRNVLQVNKATSFRRYVRTDILLTAYTSPGQSSPKNLVPNFTPAQTLSPQVWVQGLQLRPTAIGALDARTAALDSHSLI
jgi:hypothetical protein